MRRERSIDNILLTGIIFAVTAILLGGCATNRAPLSSEVQAAASLTKSQEPPEYRIQPGDQLEIKLFYNPELNETILVRPDGKISLQLIDEVQAAGLTPSGLSADLTRRYTPLLRRPVLTVLVRTFTGLRVYVGGEVANPGLLNLSANMTALQAVINAGGLRETAKPEGAILIRRGPDNRPIPLRVDLGRAIDGETPDGDIHLQPYDIVYVPKTWIAEANKFVNQYIERLLLFRGFTLGLGFTYNINPETVR